ncbi:MAG: hypothetical protein EBR86_10500 [Planctomycetia bacterium]|nr:hypothetical protein [Planctomycetia bacterium]
MPSIAKTCSVSWARSVTTIVGSRPGRRSTHSPCAVLNVPLPSPAPPKQLTHFASLSKRWILKLP